VRISECNTKKQEVDFDFLCLWVPPTDKSCNHWDEFSINNIVNSHWKIQYLRAPHFGLRKQTILEMMSTKMRQVNSTISVYTYCQFNYFRTVLPEPPQVAHWHRNLHTLVSITEKTFVSHYFYCCFKLFVPTPICSGIRYIYLLFELI